MSDESSLHPLMTGAVVAVAGLTLVSIFRSRPSDGRSRKDQEAEKTR